MKNMLGNDSGDAERDAARLRGTTGDDEGLTNESSRLTNPNRASRQLPSGTGPGTTGKGGSRRLSQGSSFGHSDARNLQSEAAMERDLERRRESGDISGYGTDAAAAAGGSLSNSHQGVGTGHTYGEFFLSFWPRLYRSELFFFAKTIRARVERRPPVTSPHPLRRLGLTPPQASNALARPRATTSGILREKLPRPD